MNYFTSYIISLTDITLKKNQHPIVTSDKLLKYLGITLAIALQPLKRQH